MLRVERQARDELEALRLCPRAQPLQVGPRRLGVDVVDRHRRDTAPVVDARVEEHGELVVGEVRRRLHVPTRSEQDPRRGDRPEVLLERRVRMRRHARPRLGAEVLHDHLADVAVLLAERPEGEQRIDPLLPRLADPDQDPARERHAELARGSDRLQTARRDLVRRGPVRQALPGQPVGDGLEHDPHRRGDRSQRRDLLAAHHTRVEVRQKPGLVEHEPRAALEVLERRRAAARRELLARHLVTQLRLVAEREQRLGAAGRRPCSCDREHLALGQERALAAPRRPGERAVPADVAAERRQRDEDLRRVGDASRVGSLATESPSLGHELVERRVEKVGDEVAHARRGRVDSVPARAVSSLRIAQSIRNALRVEAGKAGACPKRHLGRATPHPGVSLKADTSGAQTPRACPVPPLAADPVSA